MWSGLAFDMILLKDIWPMADLREYKLHFAVNNGKQQPLDVWVRNPEDWQGWQEYRQHRNDFNRPYIFSVMDFYRERDIWLFGGVFRVIARHSDRYEVELTSRGKPFIGRLKLKSDYIRGRLRRGVKFENHYESLEVAEVLREPFSGRDFPGYQSIDLTFPELENLVARQRPDWRSALSHVNGVYLITDAATGKRYVGSAYGEEGIWGRWAEYAHSGHGGNKQLRGLVKRDPTYPRANFRYTLLECFPFGTPDPEVIRREGFWKDVLLTRKKEFGFNSN